MSITIRHRTIIALLLAALLVPLVARPADAAVDGGAEARFVQLVNQARAHAGLSALTVASDLVTVARRHSARMADSDSLHHNPNLADEVTGWQSLGENVGRGPTVDSIHQALMDSPGHRANILSSRFTQIGVGVEVREGGRIWVTQVFRLPYEAPAPEPQPEPEPEPQPAAAPQTAPEPAPAKATAAAVSSPSEAPPPAAPAAPAQEGPAEQTGTDGFDHATFVLTQLSARDLGMSVSEVLSAD